MRKSFAEIAIQSFLLLSQNFVLTYPLLFFFMLLAVLVPGDNKPALELRWILLFTGIFLIFCAVMAGSYTMTAEAVRQHLDRQKNPPKPLSLEDDPALFNPFADFVSLLKVFFPGVGQYFLRFVLGGFVQAVVVGLVWLWFERSVHANGSDVVALQKMSALQELAAKGSNVNPQTFIGSFSALEQQQFAVFSGMFLCALGMYGAFYFLTLYWPAFVVLKEKPVWSAYWESLRQCAARPLTLLAIICLFVSLHMTMAFLPQSGGAFLVALWHFLTVLLSVYFSIVVVMTVADTHGVEPVLPTPAKGTLIDKQG